MVRTFNRYFHLLIVIAALNVSLPLSAHADMTFDFPVACTLGTDCWVVNYVDVGGNEDAEQDFACGPRTYEGHKGTDIGLADRVQMQSGVYVSAAAAGKIIQIRDGTDDVQPGESLPDNDEKACGNGVFINHGNGYTTVYCHLLKDSIRVHKNQRIKQGWKIGKVGQSGNAAFPHLHFGVFKDNVPIDPFTGKTDTEACGSDDSESLWAENDMDMSYQPVIFYAGGFKNSVPDFTTIKIDAHAPETLAADSDVIAAWIALFGVQKDDYIRMEIKDPSGKVIAGHTIRQEKTRARQFYYVGKRLKGEVLTPGDYILDVKLRRETDSEPLTHEANYTVTVQ